MGPLDIAWCAGLYEGEGTVFYSPKRNQVTLAVVLTDEEPVARFAAITGCGLYGPYTRLAWKPYWRAETRKRQLVRDLADIFDPWLSPRRRLQLQDALSSLTIHRVRQGESGYGECGNTTEVSQAGYRRHQSRGEVACDQCMESYRMYMRQWQSNRDKETQ